MFIKMPLYNDDESVYINPEYIQMVNVCYNRNGSNKIAEYYKVVMANGSAYKISSTTARALIEFIGENFTVTDLG